MLAWAVRPLPRIACLPACPCTGASHAVRRFLALPGQPGLSHAARQLGIRNAILTSQLRQLEVIVGTALLRTGPDGRLTLTAYGERFARDVIPALESLAQSPEPEHQPRSVTRVGPT